MTFRTTALANLPIAQSRALPIVHWHPPSQIRKSKCRSPVAAVDRSKKCKQGGILRDRQELPIAERPSSRRKIKAEGLNLANERFGHKINKLRCVKKELEPF